MNLWNFVENDRLSRSYYWLFYAVVLYGSFALGIFEAITHPSAQAENAMGFSWQLLTTVIGIYLCVKRMHDVNKSGWWIFVPIYSIVVPLATKGDGGENQYGPPSEELPSLARKIVGGLLIGALMIMFLSIGLLLLG